MKYFRHVNKLYSIIIQYLDRVREITVTNIELAWILTMSAELEFSEVLSGAMEHAQAAVFTLAQLSCTMLTKHNLKFSVPSFTTLCFSWQNTS